MKNLLLPFLLVLALALGGCAKSDRTRNSQPNPPAVRGQFHRENDEAFSPDERNMILAVKRHLAHSDKRPKAASDDAYYRVRRTPDGDGYAVFVVYVTGYDGPESVFTPCVHNEVFVRQDGTVVKVLVGPECWPGP
jgi:hypothetical protein